MNLPRRPGHGHGRVARVRRATYSRTEVYCGGLRSRPAAGYWGALACTVRWYARPEGDKNQLRVAPALDSWNKADDPDQTRLRAFIDDTEELVAASRVDGIWALRLDVGLPGEEGLLHQKDLDNYALRLAFRLQDAGLVSVWCTKQQSEQSFVRIESAREVPPPKNMLIAEPTASYARPDHAYHQQIQAAVAAAAQLPADRPVRLELAFVVGPAWNWLNLWKPTIDALVPLLGHSGSRRTWDPLDGRITELGMHLTVEEGARHVVVGIAAECLEPS